MQTLYEAIRYTPAAPLRLRVETRQVLFWSTRRTSDKRRVTF